MVFQPISLELKSNTEETRDTLPRSARHKYWRVKMTLSMFFSLCYSLLVGSGRTDDERSSERVTHALCFITEIGVFIGLHLTEVLSLYSRRVFPGL